MPASGMLNAPVSLTICSVMIIVSLHQPVLRLSFTVTYYFFLFEKKTKSRMEGDMEEAPAGEVAEHVGHWPGGHGQRLPWGAGPVPPPYLCMLASLHCVD